MRRAPTTAAILAGPVLALSLMLAGCDLGPGDDMAREGGDSSETGAVPVTAPTRSAEPVGDPVNAPALPGQRLQEAAAVMQVHAMPDQNAKVFGVAGGDPAINGLMTYLGLYVDAATGWRLYEIGNYESWRVTEEGPGRVVLDVRESRLDPATTEVVTEDKRFIVGFASQDDAPPPSVTVTPAR